MIINPFSEWGVIKNNDINREEYSIELFQKGNGFVDYDYEKIKKLLLELNLDFTLKYSSFSHFLIYAIEETAIRKFEDDEKAKVLGIRGEGLFKLLFEMNQNQSEEFQEIIENLELIDWFDGFEIPQDLVFTERIIEIKDRFLEEGL